LKKQKRKEALFTKMVLKAKKEAPIPTKAEAKAKTLKAKKTCTHGHRKKIHMSPIFRCPKTLQLQRQSKKHRKSPHEKQAG
jgi:large subunit ribosomal protein L23Ae